MIIFVSLWLYLNLKCTYIHTNEWTARTIYSALSSYWESRTPLSVLHKDLPQVLFLSCTHSRTLECSSVLYMVKVTHRLNCFVGFSVLALVILQLTLILPQVLGLKMTATTVQPQPSFLQNPGPTILRMALPTMGWALSHQSLIKKMPYRFAYGQSVVKC